MQASPYLAQMLKPRFQERNGQFSPDGRWVTYESDVSGQLEIYVQPFPEAKEKWQVSTGGGNDPRWRADGKELFYLSGDGKLMVVGVKPGSSFEAGVPKTLFDLAPLRAVVTVYAVTADGQRFFFVTRGEATANLQFTVVVNWMAEAKK